jgi:hypothetical protein
MPSRCAASAVLASRQCAGSAPRRTCRLLRCQAAGPHLGPGRRPGEHQTARTPSAEYRPYEDVGSSEQAHCGARHEARAARLLETLLRLFKAFDSQHANGTTV